MMLSLELYHPASSVQRAALMTLPRNQESFEAVLAADFLPNPTAHCSMGYMIPATQMDASDTQVRLAALLDVAEMLTHSTDINTLLIMLYWSEIARISIRLELQHCRHRKRGTYPG